jgi:hypothetical protein
VRQVNEHIETDEEKKLGKEIQTLSNEVRFMKDELAYLRRRITRHSSSNMTLIKRPQALIVGFSGGHFFK